MYQPVRAHLVPIEVKGWNKNDLLLAIENASNFSIGDLAIAIMDSDTDRGFKSQQLAITSPESKIHTGNSYVITLNDGSKEILVCQNLDEAYRCNDKSGIYGEACELIVAAYPTIKGIPTLTPDFMQEYCKRSGIGDLEMEMNTIPAREIWSMGWMFTPERKVPAIINGVLQVRFVDANKTKGVVPDSNDELETPIKMDNKVKKVEGEVITGAECLKRGYSNDSMGELFDVDAYYREIPNRSYIHKLTYDQYADYVLSCQKVDAERNIADSGSDAVEFADWCLNNAVQHAPKYTDWYYKNGFYSTDDLYKLFKQPKK